MIICIIGLFFISTASAADLNETNDEIMELDEISNDNKELAMDESNLITTNHTPTNYGEIQNSIENSQDGDTIIINGYYLFEDVITVNKTVTIQGINNATVDGNFKVRLFTVTAGNVLFKNITFKNGYSDNGGAINGECNVVNCTFIGNSAIKSGGAIFKSSAINCTFVNNTAKYGGAISTNWANGPFGVKNSAYNCDFINNSAQYGGAIDSCTVRNCSFVNNSAEYEGGAMRSGNAIKCFFKNNSLLTFLNYGYGGGALISSTAINCTFVNNSGVWGNAICRGNAENCSFINHTESYTIYYSDIVNCVFINSTSITGGSAIDCIFNNSGEFSSSATRCLFINSVKRPVTGGTMLNCTFINNTDGAISGGTAINCYFINNSAINGGAIFSGNAINCTFINNSAEYGGAMYGNSAVNCTFINNTANYGGAVFFGPYDSYGGYAYVANLFNCTFINNSAEYGGAVSSHKLGNYFGGESLKTISITHCRFINNSATIDGGSIEISNTYRNHNLSECIFINSTAKDGSGGAIYSNGGTIESSDFINCSSNQGGAIYATSNVNVTSSNFTNCISNDGSSYMGSTDSSLYNITDCIFEEAPIDVSYHYYSTLTVNSLFIAKGEKAILYANLTNVCGPIVNKRINFEFNGRKFYAQTNSKGIAEFDVNNYLTDLGETLIDLNFAGDDINYPSSTNASVYINKYYGNLTVKLDGQFYNDTYLIFNLINLRNVPISDAPIQLTFSNGEVINLTTDFEGNAIYQIPFIPDTYNVSAFVNDDFVTVNSVEVNNIVIKKLIGEIEITPLNENHTLMIKLINPDDSSAIYRNVKINLDIGPNPIVNEELFTNEKGYVIYDLLNFTKGTYSISATVKGDYKDFYDYYLSNFIISNLLDSKINFTNNITFDYGEFGSTNFTVDGGRIGNVSVINHTEAIISVANNVITVLNLAVGNYTLLVETIPDDYHNPINATLNVTVNTVKSKVTFSAGVSFEYGGSASIYVTVEGGTVDGKSIQILDHPEAKITFEKNMITVSGLNPGTYTLRVESIPDSDHKAGEGTVGITVRKATAVIKASKLTVALKSGALWTIKIIDSKTKKPIINMKVTLKVYTGNKYKTVTLNTNSKGEANYQTRSLTKGNHRIVVSATHNGYNFNTLTSSINVIKPTKLSFKVKKNIAKDGSSLSITVKKGKKPINGIKIKLLVYTGKKYKTVVLKSKTKGKYKGVCGWGTNKISVGSHKIIIRPVSIKYSGSKTVKMNIKKSAKKYPNWETKI